MPHEPRGNVRPSRGIDWFTDSLKCRPCTNLCEFAQKTPACEHLSSSLYQINLLTIWHCLLTIEQRLVR